MEGYTTYGGAMALPDNEKDKGQLSDLLGMGRLELEKHLQAALRSAESADNRGVQGRPYVLLYRCLSESLNEGLGLHMPCEWPLTRPCQWDLLVQQISKKVSAQWVRVAPLESPRQQFLQIIEQACLDAEDLCRREDVWRFDVQRNFQQVRETLSTFAGTLDD
jgi:hypothetical protein